MTLRNAQRLHRTRTHFSIAHTDAAHCMPVWSGCATQTDQQHARNPWMLGAVRRSCKDLPAACSHVPQGACNVRHAALHAGVRASLPAPSPPNNSHSAAQPWGSLSHSWPGALRLCAVVAWINQRLRQPCGSVAQLARRSWAMRHSRAGLPRGRPARTQQPCTARPGTPARPCAPFARESSCGTGTDTRGLSKLDFTNDSSDPLHGRL